MTTTPTPKTALEELMAAHKATTQGEWIEGQSNKPYSLPTAHSSDLNNIYTILQATHTADLRFSIAAHNSLPAIAEEMEKLQARQKQLEDAAMAALKFISNYRVPQTKADAAVQVFLQAAPVLDELTNALRDLLKESE